MKQLFTWIVVVLGTSLQLSAQSITTTPLPTWAMGPFVRPASGNPVIAPDSTTRFDCPMYSKSIDWESNDTFNPAAAVQGNRIVVLYRAEDKSGKGIGGRTSRLGFATSRNGVSFQRNKQPVLYPDRDDQQAMEWTGGCEDPRVARSEEGLYVLTYTQWNHQTPRLAVATSKDLVHWTKHGPAFKQAYGGKFFNMATKSASLITKLEGGRQVISRINGKYWMYWGEANVYAATSTDLVNWEPVTTPEGKLKVLMSPRKGFFDSALTECGPPAITTDQGIVLLYNGKNRSGSDRDPRYTANSYCAGQALFDKNDPLKFVSRLDQPFLQPEASFEKSGQYPAGTVFVEGMAYLGRRWFLYYGCADSRVAVAIWDPSAKTGK